MINYQKEFKKCLQDYEVNCNKPNLNIEFAIYIIDKFLKRRYEKEFKQYNFNQEKSNDKFIAEKNLEYLNVYIEELFLLDKILNIEPDRTHWLSARKEMRRILHKFWEVVNEECTKCRV